MASALFNAATAAATTAWKSVTEGPEAAITYGLYQGSSWIGTQACDGTAWLAKFVGNTLAQIPDSFVNSNPKDYYYTKFVNEGTEFCRLSSEFAQKILSSLAPNADKVNFGLTELVGPSLLFWASASYALDEGVHALKNLKAIVKGSSSEPSAVIQKGPMMIWNYENQSTAKRAREAVLSTIIATVLGSVAYFTGNGLHDRLTEAGVSQEIQKGALASVATICALPYLRSILNFNKKLTQEDLDKLADKQLSGARSLMNEKTAQRSRMSTGYSIPVADRSPTAQSFSPTAIKSRSPSLLSSISSNDSSWDKSSAKVDYSAQTKAQASSFKASSRQSTLGRHPQGVEYASR